MRGKGRKSKNDFLAEERWLHLHVYAFAHLVVMYARFDMIAAVACTFIPTTQHGRWGTADG